MADKKDTEKEFFNTLRAMQRTAENKEITLQERVDTLNKIMGRFLHKHGKKPLPPHLKKILDN